MNLSAFATQPLCPLCAQLPKHRTQSTDPDCLEIECVRCGHFSITVDALGHLDHLEMHLLSAACRMWTGPEWPKINTDNIRAMIEQVPKLTVTEKLDVLLQLVATRTSYVGVGATFDPGIDYPLLVARNVIEAWFLVNGLKERHFIRSTSSDGSMLALTLEGWERLDAIRQSGRHSALVFVAMWFHTSMNQLYADAIEPAIREAGYLPVRIDRKEHVNRIDDEIIGQIRRSRFMVADFTGQRHGVYFEAGLMMGLGRKVIWMCDQREIHDKEVHFDVRQYNFVDWISVEDARKRLYFRIIALEGEGPGPAVDRKVSGTSTDS